MALNVEIKCINKTNRTDPHERIQNLGSVTNGQRWKLSVSDAIAGIERGEWKFYTVDGGKSVWVGIATHNGHKYLKTEADGVHPDNLLSLPECP